MYLTVVILLTGGPAKPAGPGGPTSPRSPCGGAEEMVSHEKNVIDSGEDFLNFYLCIIVTGIFTGYWF